MLLRPSILRSLGCLQIVGLVGHTVISTVELGRFPGQPSLRSRSDVVVELQAAELPGVFDEPALGCLQEVTGEFVSVAGAMGWEIEEGEQ